MTAAALHFAALLDRERTAALAADVDALAEIQEQKIAAVENLHSAGLSDVEIERLSSAARDNLTLLRHLVGCLRGLIQEDDQTYTASGTRIDESLMPSGHSRGRL